jgi:hypothetical protein
MILGIQDLVKAYFEKQDGDNDAESFIVDYDKDRIDIDMSEGSIAFRLRKDRSTKTVATGMELFDKSPEESTLNAEANAVKNDSEKDGGWRKV